MEATQNQVEDLRKITTAEQVQGIWVDRFGRMRSRRQNFEPLWKNGITKFIESIVRDTDKRLYNTYYEQYDLSVYSKDGLRFSKLAYPLLPSVVLRAMATEFKNRPKANFVVVGSNDQNRSAPFRALFSQVLSDMGADEEDFEIFLSRNIFGTAAVFQNTDIYDVHIEDPYFDALSGTYKYKSKKKTIKKVNYRNIDLRHVLIDEKCRKSSLRDCNYACIDEYFSPLEFAQRYSNKRYDQKKVQEAMEVTTSLPSDTYTTLLETQTGDFVKVSHCFDRIADRYHILAGDKLINEINNPIPRIAGREGKDIPLALAVKYKLPNCPYGYADSHLINSFAEIKNLMRVMILEITQKAAKPTLLVDPLSPFDEQGFEWGQDILRVDPKSFGQVTINPDLESLYRLDSTTDNDITRVTGVDINDTQSAPEGETARKTIIRRESQNALLELGMEQLTVSFYKRLYSLIQADIILHYGGDAKKGAKIKVKTEGEMFDRGKNNKIIVEAVKGIRYFDLKSTDFDIEMEVEPELGNIATSKELDKALAKEGLDALAPYIQGIEQSKAIEFIQDLYDMPDLRQGGAAPTQKPEDVAQKGIPTEMLPPNVQIQKEQQAEQSQLPPQNEQPQNPGMPEPGSQGLG